MALDASMYFVLFGEWNPTRKNARATAFQDIAAVWETHRERWLVLLARF